MYCEQHFVLKYLDTEGWLTLFNKHPSPQTFVVRSLYIHFLRISKIGALLFSKISCPCCTLNLTPGQGSLITYTYWALCSEFLLVEMVSFFIGITPVNKRCSIGNLFPSMSQAISPRSLVGIFQFHIRTLLWLVRIIN